MIHVSEQSEGGPEKATENQPEEEEKERMQGNPLFVQKAGVISSVASFISLEFNYTCYAGDKEPFLGIAPVPWLDVY